MSGCVHPPRSDISSNAAKGYTAHADSIYVLSHVSSNQPKFDAVLETSIKETFLSRGYKLTYEISNGLELDSNIHLSKAKQNKSQLILVINPAGGTINGYGHFIFAKYDIKAIDLNIEKTVFRSLIELRPHLDTFVGGHQWNRATADKLTNDIYDELLNNNIILQKNNRKFSKQKHDSIDIEY